MSEAGRGRDWADDGGHAAQRLHELATRIATASVAWAIGMTIWLTHQGAGFAQLLVDLRCDALRVTSEEWRQCYKNAQGPAEGDTWFLAGFRSGQLLLIVGPPVLLLILGAVVVKTGAWVARDFSGIK
jgi:hypothetical protein